MQHTLATGIVIRDGQLLLVASRYANHEQPLWNLPGGRQQPGELLAETVVREVFEETGLRVEPGEVAYIGESYDGDTHFLNVAFTLRLARGESSFETRAAPVLSEVEARAPQDDRASSDHVAAVEWVSIDQVADRIAVAVVREPLLAYLRGELPERYAGFHEAGITIEWPADSR